MKRLFAAQEYESDRFELTPDVVLTQTVIPTHDHFSSIRLLFFNQNLGASGEYELVVKAEDATERKIILTESNIGWGSINRFDFEPFANSKGKTFSISIRSMEQKNSSHSAQLDYQFVKIPYSKENRYDFGSMKINNNVQSGDIYFQLYYSTTISGFVKDSTIEFYKKFKVDTSFFIFYLVTIFLLFGTCCFLFFRRFTSSKTFRARIKK